MRNGKNRRVYKTHWDSGHNAVQPLAIEVLAAYERGEKAGDIARRLGLTQKRVGGIKHHHRRKLSVTARRNQNTKLTASQVVKMLELRTNGATQAQAVCGFPITAEHFSDIDRGVCWTSLVYQYRKTCTKDQRDALALKWVSMRDWFFKRMHYKRVPQDVWLDAHCDLALLLMDPVHARHAVKAGLKAWSNNRVKDVLRKYGKQQGVKRAALRDKYRPARVVYTEADIDHVFKDGSPMRDSFVSEMSATTDDFEALERQQAVRDAIDSLPNPRDALIARRRFLEFAEMRVIGEELGLTESRVSQILGGTAQSQLGSIEAQLQQRLKHLEPEGRLLSPAERKQRRASGRGYRRRSASVYGRIGNLTVRKAGAG